MMTYLMRMIVALCWAAGALAPLAAGAQTDAAAPAAPPADRGVVADSADAANAGLVAGPDALVDASANADRRDVATAPAPATNQAVPAARGNGNGLVIDLPVAGDSAPLPEGSGLQSGNTNLISISLDAVPVNDVVNMFSKISGANIIMAAVISTNALVTANLKNVEWKTALSMALGSVNLSLIEDPSGILMVVTSEMYRDKLQQIENTKPLVTRTFAVQYLNAVDFIEQVKLLKLLSPRGTIIASQSRDQDRTSLKSSPLATDVIQNPSVVTKIIVTDIKGYVDKVGDIIQALDKREPQVFIEARIIDVVSDDIKKLGFDWSMLDRFGATLKMQDLKWSFSDDHNLVNSAINKDNQFDNRSTKDDLNRWYDITGNEYQKVEYEEQPPESGNYVAVPQATRTVADSINRGREISSVKTDTTTDTRKEAKMGTAILNVSDVSLFLSALQRSENTEMISHPLIVVGNKVEAKIHVGERYPTIISTKQAANPQQGQTESFSERVEWNDLGLTLWVIPEIDHEVDMIRLTVNPQMSTHVKDITTPAGSVYPVISTRQVVTRANVPSKHTVVIGGLIDNQKSNKEIRVPILGDIPLLGLLFKHNQDIISKHNLLIMLTPTILDEKAPLTGLESVAQQSVDRLEKTPMAPKADPSLNTVVSNNLPEQAPGMTGDVPTTPSSSANLAGTAPGDSVPSAVAGPAAGAQGEQAVPPAAPATPAVKTQ